MEGLGIEPKLLLAQAINFGLFFFIFKKFLAGPFSKFIDEERQKEQERDRLYNKAKDLEVEMKKKEEELKSSLKKEAEKIFESAKKDAEIIKAQIIEDAKKDSLELREKAKKQIQQERDEIVKDAKEKISDLSVFIVKSALKDVLTGEMKKEITKAIIKQSSKKSLTV